MGFYVKNPEVIERLSEVNNFAFDKTGTITVQQESEIVFHGNELDDKMKSDLKSLFSQSNHPLSKRLFEHLKGATFHVEQYEEIPSKGIQGKVDGHLWRAGSALFIGEDAIVLEGSTIMIKKEEEFLGFFELKNRFRSDLPVVFSELIEMGPVSVLTGDTEAEKDRLNKVIEQDVELKFNLNPEQKLEYIELLQSNGYTVLMIGDGLNDAGALQQSNLGISISEDVNSFTPGSDGILDAKQFGLLPDFIRWSQSTRTIILISFGISFAYNIIGLSFAILGLLSPVIAAILMPISSISVVVFVTIATNFIARKRKRNS